MKRRTIRVAIFVSLLCACACAVVGYRLYNKPHRSAATENAVATTATELAAAYGQDEAGANKKYLGNAVQVSGTVSEVSVNQQNRPVVILTGSDMSGVQCTMQENGQAIKKGDAVTIKGFCSGYLTDVIIDRCIIVSK